MGGSFFCFGLSNPRKLPRKDSVDHRNVSLTTSIMEFIKPSCLWRPNKKKRRKKLKQQQKVKMVKDCTLKEWFSVSSPCEHGKSSLCNNIIGAEQNGSWVYQHSNDVDDHIMSSCRNSFSQQKLLIDFDSVEGDSSCLSSRRNSIDKVVKKRVSFKLPEEADIFISAHQNQILQSDLNS